MNKSNTNECICVKKLSFFDEEIAKWVEIIFNIGDIFKYKKVKITKDTNTYRIYVGNIYHTFSENIFNLHFKNRIDYRDSKINYILND